MYVEIIPSVIIDIMREPLKYTSEVGRSVNDSCGYESLDAAILNAEFVATSLFGEVVPENLFFVFGQVMEALFHSPVKLPLPPPSFNDFDGVSKDRHKEKGNCDNECKSNKLAIILCKLKDAELFKGFFAGKEQKGCNYPECYEISWSELQELKERFCKFGEHG